jgi:hypothetical protein
MYDTVGFGVLSLSRFIVPHKCTTGVTQGRRECSEGPRRGQDRRFRAHEVAGKTTCCHGSRRSGWERSRGLWERVHPGLQDLNFGELGEDKRCAGCSPVYLPLITERGRNSGLQPPPRPNTANRTSSGEDEPRGSLSDHSDYGSSGEETQQACPERRLVFERLFWARTQEPPTWT